MKVSPESTLQHLIFKSIREKIPPNLSFVHEIAELLNISYDSAYRRIRAEKELDLEELRLLVTHYEISLDAFLQGINGSILFNSVSVRDGMEGVQHWMRTVGNFKGEILRSKNRCAYYCTRDIPVFQYLYSPDVLAFKYYFYNKVQYKLPEYHETFFSFQLPFTYDAEMAKQMITLQNQVPKVEIWSCNTFNSTLDQVKYCYDSGFFKNGADARQLLCSFEQLCHHIQHQAEFGMSFIPGTEPAGDLHNYKIYFNDGCFTDNLALIKADNFKIGFIGYNGLNFLTTSNAAFCVYLESIFNDLMQSSDLISETSAKERNHIFSELYRRIDLLKESLV